MQATLKRYFTIESLLEPKRALIIYGPRRVGKTTLLRQYLNESHLKYRLDSGDNLKVQEILGSQDFDRLLDYAKGYQLIAIDEAQNIPNVGIGLKILIDEVPGLLLIATGSSSFNLASSVGEPLTGRKTTITLYPISQLELVSQWNVYDLKTKLEEFLIFGSYPDIITAQDKARKIQLLRELVESYILRDILAFERVKGAKLLLDLLKLLAFQVGQLVSHNELANMLGLDAKTVGRYLDLLEKSFIIFRVGGFSRNLRNEIVNKQKYYFLDNGIRNAIIAQFNPLTLRQDVGALWENFVVSERLKYNSYTGFYGNSYFWRTYDGSEIDIVEEIENQVRGFECKWSVKSAKIKAPKAFIDNYHDASFQVITPQNYLEFVAGLSNP